MTEFRNKVEKKYNKFLENSFESAVIKLNTGLTFKMYYQNDREGLWFGFKLFKLNSKGKTIADSVEGELRQVIDEAIKTMDHQPKLNSSLYHFC